MRCPRSGRSIRRDVAIGRERAAAERRKPYVAALRDGDAGSVRLQRGEKPAMVKGLLQEAARQENVRIRSSWTDGQQRALVWKKVGAR